MYGFKESEFNGNVNNDSIEISSVKFSTNFGTGPTDTDLPYESNIELYEDLSKNELFIQTESTKSSRKIVDSSFTIIRLKISLDLQINMQLTILVQKQYTSMVGNNKVSRE